MAAILLTPPTLHYHFTPMKMQTFPGFLAIVLLAACATASFAQQREKVDKIDERWTNISDGVIKKLTADGKQLAWPGDTAGVAVDPATGDVYMIVAGEGVWKSVDSGKTFERCDGGKVGGRCETAYALNFDPAGKRLACFMLDGKCAWTGDAGKTWQAFTDAGRNWDFAAVDWSAPEVKTIFAGHHETGGEVLFSNDGGKTWAKVFKDAEFDKTGGLGVFDAKTLVYTQKGKGIQRSTDAGATWTKVSDAEPIGRVARIHKGTAHWLAKDGILASKDAGETWKLQGRPHEGSIGPMIDPQDEKRIVVAGVKGIARSNDGGETWTTVIAQLPPGYDVPKAGWFSNVAWDPIHDVFYLSKMGKPTLRLEGDTKKR
jgi:photosystem II stability/assembly factor-like uncharacterized protein